MARPTMMHQIARAGVFAALSIAFASPAFAPCQSPAAFGSWLQGFKQEAVAQGVSPDVVASALNGLTYDPATIAKDRGQGVFAQTFLQFSERMVSGNRIQTGGALLKKYANLFKQMTADTDRRAGEEQPPRRPLRERLKERPASRRRPF